jgi:hypothetical protein
MSPAQQPENGQSETPHSGGPADAEGRTPQVIQSGAGNVDKIRDILFGTQMRDYETRFARLEETLVKETAEIRETNRRRMDQLENYVKKEFEAVQMRLKTERDEQSDVAGQHARELKEMSESLTRRLRDLDDRGAAVERDLRSQLLQQSRDLADEIRATHDQLSTLLERRFHELRHGKTDRAALATLFNELALRLNDQFQIPGADG